MFLCNLAISDLFMAVVGEPLLISYDFMQWYSDCYVLTVCSIIVALFGVASFVTIVASTLDRYVAITFHLQYNELVTVKRVIGVCLFLWLVSLTMSFLLYLSNSGAIILGCGALFLIMVMVFCYWKIMVVLRYHHNQIQAQIRAVQGNNTSTLDLSHFQKTVWNLLFIIGWFVVTNSLFISTTAIIFIKGATSAPDVLIITWYISICFVCLNSLVNPFIYCWRLEEMRLATKETVKVVFARICGSGS